MATTMPTAALAALWAATRRPVAGGQADRMHERLKRVAEQGWIYRSGLCDLIEDSDYRLRRGAIDISVEDILSAFGYRLETVARRPGRRSTGVIMLDALRASDLASLLCDLDAMGFLMPAATLCDYLRPSIETRATVTSSDISVLWSGRTIGRGKIDLKVDDPPAVADYDEGRLPTGHRYFATTDQAGQPVSIEIKGPKYRNTPAPTLRTCDVCGTTYLHGDPESSAKHRQAHRRVAYVTSPKPLPAMIAHLVDADPYDPVMPHSPKWMQREMYERATRFRREMGFDFVQWTAPGRVADQEARGHLLTDEHGAIHGACSFRPHGGTGRWGLQWIWVRPEARRTGILSRQWEDMRRRYGDFLVEGPVSPAMQAFLERRGEARLMD